MSFIIPVYPEMFAYIIKGIFTVFFKIPWEYNMSFLLTYDNTYGRRVNAHAKLGNISRIILTIYLKLNFLKIFVFEILLKVEEINLVVVVEEQIPII